MVESSRDGIAVTVMVMRTRRKVTELVAGTAEAPGPVLVQCTLCFVRHTPRMENSGLLDRHKFSSLDKASFQNMAVFTLLPVMGGSSRCSRSPQKLSIVCSLMDPKG